MKVYAPGAVLVSTLNATGWDANLVVPAGFLITTDHIAETTAAHGTVFNTDIDQAAAAAIDEALLLKIMLYGGG
jgi:hypothetical protein